MLMILCQWIRHKILNRLLQYHLGVPLDLCIFWTCGSNSEFLRWQRSINGSALIPCFSDHLIFVSDFRQLPCRFSLVFPFFVHHCLCIWDFHCFRHRTKFVHQIVVTQWIHSFSCNMIFMILVRSSFHSNSHTFVSFNNTRMFRLVFSNCATGFPVRTTLKFLGITAGIGISNFLREFLVFKIGEVNTP